MAASAPWLTASAIPNCINDQLKGNLQNRCNTQLCSSWDKLLDLIHKEHFFYEDDVPFRQTWGESNVCWNMKNSTNLRKYMCIPHIKAEPKHNTKTCNTRTWFQYLLYIWIIIDGVSKIIALWFELVQKLFFLIPLSLSHDQIKSFTIREIWFLHSVPPAEITNHQNSQNKLVSSCSHCRRGFAEVLTCVWLTGGEVDNRSMNWKEADNEI